MHFFRIPRNGETTEITFTVAPITSRTIHYRQEGTGIRTRWIDEPCKVIDCPACIAGEAPQVRYRMQVIAQGIEQTIDMHRDLYLMVLHQMTRCGGLDGKTFRIGSDNTPYNPMKRTWILEEVR